MAWPNCPVVDAKKLQELKKLRKLTIAGVTNKSIDELKLVLPELIVTVQ